MTQRKAEILASVDVKLPRGSPATASVATWFASKSGSHAVIAPLTQACFNPARDFGPRLFAALAGWGTIALPGPRGAGFLTVYILAPLLGAVAGGGLYMRILRPCLTVEEGKAAS